VIHASPPCQKFSRLATLRPDKEYPDLLTPMREKLKTTTMPYVIENVPGAPFMWAAIFCGTSFGLNLRRHRWFGASFLLHGPRCKHWEFPDYVSVYGHGRDSHRAVGIEEGKWAMGIDWMNRDELSQAIPPAYTEFIGKQLMRHLELA